MIEQFYAVMINEQYIPVKAHSKDEVRRILKLVSMDTHCVDVISFEPIGLELHPYRFSDEMISNKAVKYRYRILITDHWVSIIRYLKDMKELTRFEIDRQIYNEQVAFFLDL